MKKLSPNDRKYIAEYRRWFDKLPERQKAIMKKQGLDKPHIDDYTTRQAFDISDIQIADTSRDEEPDGAKVFPSGTSDAVLRNSPTSFSRRF